MEINTRLNDEILGLFIFLDEPEGLPYLNKKSLNELYKKGYSEKEITAAVTYLLAEKYIYESSVIGNIKESSPNSFYYHLTTSGIRIRLEGGFEKIQNEKEKAKAENEIKAAISELQRKQLEQQTDNFIAPKYTLLISIIALVLSGITVYLNYTKSQKETEVERLKQQMDTLQNRFTDSSHLGLNGTKRK